MPSRPLRSLAAAGLLALAASAALAGASSTPIGYVPDPALRTAPVSDLEGRVRRACAITQAKLQAGPESSFERPCGCYARQTLRSFDEVELASYRETGYFNDSARAKALAAIDSCRLKRPI